MQAGAMITSALTLCVAYGCGQGDWILEPDPVTVDSATILVPPAGYPFRDDAFVTQEGNGYSKLTRSEDGATAEALLLNQTPGHVLVYSTVTFNHPEHCVEGEDRLPVPGPCRGNGPLDQRDGGIAEVMLSVEVWASAVVGQDGIVRFEVDLTHDMALQHANQGPGVINPEGAVVYMWVLDKGPLAPDGPLRPVQTNTLFGGCQGPPANGPLPCAGAAIVQHLPE